MLLFSAFLNCSPPPFKNNFVLLLNLLLGMELQAQQWNGSGLPTGDIWRVGSVGIGYTGIPALTSNFNINGDMNFENTGDVVH